MATKTKEKKNNFINTIKAQRLFVERNLGFDVPMFILTLILLAFGLVMLYSASYVRGIYQFGDSLHYIGNQRVYAMVGVVVLIVASKVDYHFFKNFLPIVMPLTYGLLILALFMPAYNGCHRWITIPHVTTFQPSEIAKFAVVLMFANLIERNYNKMQSFKYGVKPFFIILGSFVALLFFEPHLSCIIIICTVGGIMMLVGGTDVRCFLILFGAGIFVVLRSFFLLKDKLGRYIFPRIDSWLHPENDLQGDGYQSYQSLLAIGSGGLFGLGLGNSRQKHLHLPEPQNDFIFSVICEELGFFGGLIVVILFLALFIRGIYIATHAKDKFGAMLVIGIVSQITLQAILNMAVATNTIPNTGISLPFFSEGGTALLMVLGEIGIVLSVSRYANFPKKDDE